MRWSALLAGMRSSAHTVKLAAAARLARVALLSSLQLCQLLLQPVLLLLLLLLLRSAMCKSAHADQLAVAATAAARACGIYASPHVLTSLLLAGSQMLEISVIPFSMCVACSCPHAHLTHAACVCRSREAQTYTSVQCCSRRGRAAAHASDPAAASAPL